MATDVTQAKTSRKRGMAAWTLRISLPVSIASVILGVIVLAANLASDLYGFIPSPLQLILLGWAAFVGSILGVVGIAATLTRWLRILLRRQAFSLKAEAMDRLTDLPDYAQRVEKPATEGIKGAARFVSDRVGAVAVPAALLVVTSAAVLANGVVVGNQLDTITTPPSRSGSALPLPTLVPTRGPTPTPIPAPPVFLAVLAPQDVPSCSTNPGPFHMILTNTAHTTAGKPTTDTIRWAMSVDDKRFTLTPNRGTLTPNQSTTVVITGPFPFSIGQGIAFTYQTDAVVTKDTWTGLVCNAT